MANWTKKVPVGPSNRRKWNLEDRASLNNLKYHFAADGCSEVQYNLARQLLESNSELGEDASHAQGVYWLLSAAQQGHEESLEMLRECYKKRRGITETNEVEVKACLSMTSGERAARKAARELFACLSNGGKHITPAQLEKKMRDIYKLQKRRRRRNETASDKDEIESNGHIYPHVDISRSDMGLSEQNIITEANLVSAAVNYSHGRLPSMNNVLTLSVPHPNTLDHIPCFHRILFHPTVFFTLLYHRFIKVISSFPGTTESNVKLIILFIIYTLISSENIALFLPMLIYYLSLSIMIWATFKMLKIKHEFIDFRIWSGLFLSYGDNNVDTGGSENQFLKNNMKPYLYFFGAFVINLITYPVISNEWMPHSEITVVSFVLVFLTMIAFMYTSLRQFPDILILLSFGVNVLAKYPYEMDSVVNTGWRFLDLKVPTFCSFVIGNGIEFCLNCRAVLYLLIPGFLMHLAKRSNWHGTYTYLIPHCVTLSWLQICIISSQYATMFGLVRATLGLAGILLFLPLFGIITLMIPIFVTVEWLGLTDLKIRMVTSLIAGVVAVLASCFMAINSKTQKYVTALQIGMCIVAAALLTLPYMTSTFNTSHSNSPLFENLMHSKSVLPTADDSTPEHTISWESFYKYCDHPAWEHVNKIDAQLRCSHLEGTYIKWEGVISSVHIVKVSNYRSFLIKNYLPRWLGNIVTCFYGGKNEVECKDDEQCEDIQRIIGGNKRCNLNKWNTYEYEIKVRMHSGILSRPGEVYLKAGHQFTNFSQSVIASDRIWFGGRLINSRKLTDQITIDMVLGAGKPVVDLIAVGCTTCYNKELAPVHLEDREHIALQARLRDLLRGIKYLLNVIFNPLLTFK